MNTITNNTVNSYAYNRVNTSHTSVQSAKDVTSKSNDNTQKTAAINNTINYSNDKKDAFFKVLNEVSSESDSVQFGKNKISAGTAFMISFNKMNSQAWYSDSSNSTEDYFSSYSDLIGKVQDFNAKNNGYTNDFNSKVNNFCNVLNQRFSQYGIN